MKNTSMAIKQAWRFNGLESFPEPAYLVSMLAEAWKMQGAKEPAMLHHFRNHLIEAMSHVALHPVWKGEGKALYLALRSGLRGPGVGERAAAFKAIAHRLEVKENAKSGTKAR